MILSDNSGLSTKSISISFNSFKDLKDIDIDFVLNPESFNSFKDLLFGEDSKMNKVLLNFDRCLAREIPVLPSPMIAGILFNLEILS